VPVIRLLDRAQPIIVAPIEIPLPRHELAIALVEIRPGAPRGDVLELRDDGVGNVVLARRVGRPRRRVPPRNRYDNVRGAGTPGSEDGVGGGGVGGCGVGWSLREPVNEEAGLGDVAEGGCEGGVVACQQAPEG